MGDEENSKTRMYTVNKLCKARFLNAWL